MTIELEDQIDLDFIQRVQQEVTVSCALPFAIPTDRIPSFILQAAQWFWQNSDFAIQERMYVIKYDDICRKENAFNKIVNLPPQVLSVYGVYKVNNFMKYGAMGDFSIERMMMSSYSMMGGVGSVGGGVGLAGSGTGYSLTDVVTSLYEVDTFNQYLNAPISFNFNQFSHKLVLLGGLGHTDVIIACYIRNRIQELYNDYYFFRFVVCLVKRALATIYGTFEFKLPGGVTINYSSFTEQADNEMEKIEEWVKVNRAADLILQPNTI